ncbi:MAG: tetratricopeptide repeat protein [Oligoflexales bacterium]
MLRYVQKFSSLPKLAIYIFFLLTNAIAFAAPLPPAYESFSEIIKNYQIIGDFTIEPAERKISSEFFWRYPFPLPKAVFPVNHELGDKPVEMPATPGFDKPIQHMNYGRILFTQKNYEEARKIWLSARARYGKNFEYHRRNDYFIGLAYLKISKGIRKMFHGDIFRSEVRLTYSNTATFLSWAFMKKRDLADPMLDIIAPAALYNLAAIYYEFDRYTAAHGAAQEGLNFLRRTGRSDYRPHLRRMIAEGWIKDRQYLKAVREIDTIIRQENNREQAAFAFSRIGDIYFDLNKYELAEEAYHLSQVINREIKTILPLSFILRGESLFWLGRFADAQRSLHYGIKSISHKHAKKSLSINFRSLAFLRIADAYLAQYSKKRSNKDLLKKAKLAYYRVEHEFPNSDASFIAKVRRTCLGLPQYLGNNVKHARSTLSQMRESFAPLPVIELAWSCEVMSYGDREKGTEFVEKVKIFYSRFPNSRYLSQYIPSLIEVKSSNLEVYLKEKDYHKATLFFEKNRHDLFSNISPKRRIQLFKAYIEIGLPDKAAEFWKEFQKNEAQSQEKFLLSSLYLSEITDSKGISKNIKNLLFKTLNKYKPSYELKESTRIRGFVNRLLKSKLYYFHLPWLYHATFKWNFKDAQDLCEISYPILSKWFHTRTQTRTPIKNIWKEITRLTKIQFPLLFNKSLSCSKALLELEAEAGVHPSLSKSYGEIWLERFDWPQKSITVPLIWQASEAVRRIAPESDVSQKLWSYLAELDPSQFPEVKYAKARLDKSKTQTEQLWR